MTIYNKIYQHLETLGVIAALDEGADYSKSKVVGLMDLSLDRLDTGEDGSIRIALAHYFKQNGDLCPDPDMEIRIYPTQKMAEALTFQQALPPVYQEVYPAPRKVNLALKRQLNGFLHYWLRNCIAQGHYLGRGQ